MGYFYPEWQKIIRIGISNPPSTTGHEVKVIIPWQPGMKDDFSDLRFSDHFRTLPYFIDSSTTRSTATVWIKLTEINTACQEIFCYYGNGGAISESSGSSVFVFFDHFEGSDVSASWNKYASGAGLSVSDSILSITGAAGAQRGIYGLDASVLGTNYIYRFKAKFGSGTGFAPGILNVGSTQWCQFYWSPTWGKLTETYITAAETQTDKAIDETQYEVYEIVRNGTTSVIFKINDSTIGTHTTRIPNANLRYDIYNYNVVATHYLDWVAIRKYVSTEPTCTPTTYGINPAFYMGYLKGGYLKTRELILTAVQHLTHIDLSWTEQE